MVPNGVFNGPISQLPPGMLYIVLMKPPFLGEAYPTLNAFVLSLFFPPVPPLPVSLKMAPVVGRLAETFLAQRTREWPLASVDCPMPLVIGALVKALPALLALKGSLPRVNAKMALVARREKESLATDGTGVRLPRDMQVSVLLEGALGPKPSATILTLVGLRILVYPLVDPESL